MEKAFIGIGSNLGDKYQNCLKAVSLIGQIPACKLVAISEWYLTKPVGVVDQEWYVNGVASIETNISARDLLNHLLAIERGMGRIREEHWGPRIVDLDILLFGRAIIKEEGLKVPHPLMHLRRFVLVPMVQLAPDVGHPYLGQTMSRLLKDLPAGDQEVVPMEEH